MRVICQGPEGQRDSSYVQPSVQPPGAGRGGQRDFRGPKARDKEEQGRRRTTRGFFFFLAVPHGVRDPSSPTRDRTRAPCSGSTES